MVPLRFDLARALAHVELRVRTDESGGGFHPEHAHLTPAAALAELEASVRTEDLVVCHGDYCAPNMLLRTGG